VNGPAASADVRPGPSASSAPWSAANKPGADGQRNRSHRSRPRPRASPGIRTHRHRADGGPGPRPGTHHAGRWHTTHSGGRRSVTPLPQPRRPKCPCSITFVLSRYQPSNTGPQDRTERRFAVMLLVTSGDRGGAGKPGRQGRPGCLGGGPGLPRRRRR